MRYIEARIETCRVCGCMQIVTSPMGRCAACCSDDLSSAITSHVQRELFEIDGAAASQCIDCCRCWDLLEDDAAHAFYSACPVLPSMTLNGAGRVMRHRRGMECRAYRPMSSVANDEARTLALLGHKGAQALLTERKEELPCWACGASVSVELSESEFANGIVRQSAACLCPTCGSETVSTACTGIDAIEEVRDYVERDLAGKVVERWNRRTVVEPAMARLIEMLGDGAASMR